MTVFGAPDFDDHEQVVFLSDPAARLRAIVAIHSSSSFGAAGGGCRMAPYASDDEALADVLRLSRAMSHKLALAGIPAGGAKSVIVGDPATDKTEALLEAFGRAVQRLGGRYIVAEDVGTTPEDMDVIARQTAFVVGRKQAGSETATATAHGVFAAIRTVVAHALGRTDLEGLRVAVQGVGAVGHALCKVLHGAGAWLVVADVRERALKRIVEEFSARVVAPGEILAQAVDVVAPCALGSVLDDESIARLRCAVVAGSANNQLRDEARHGRALHQRGILWAPDFVANMGGVLGAAAGGDGPDVLVRVREKVATVMTEVLDEAERRNVSTHEAALALARAALTRLRGR